MEGLVVFFVVWAIVSLFTGWIGSMIGKPKGLEHAGFWWGFFLSWIGWIVVATMSPTVEADAARQRAIAAVNNPPAAARRPVHGGMIQPRSTDLVPGSCRCGVELM